MITDSKLKTMQYLKDSDPHCYYKDIHLFFTSKYPNCIFNYYLQSEDNLCNLPDPVSEFLKRENQDDRLVLELKFWTCSDTWWNYFVYLNPVFIIVAFYGGYIVIIVDIMQISLLTFLKYQ